MQNTSWADYIGNIGDGRKNLGEEMPVSVYRLFEFTMKDELIAVYGKEQAATIFRNAGKRAGQYVTKQLLHKEKNMNAFISELQNLMQNLKIGILRVEEIDEGINHLVVSVSEDLDCSGLPVIGEAVCNYDEGFLMGILKEYTGNEYAVIEVDCWAKGGRVCRFDAHIL